MIGLDAGEVERVEAISDEVSRVFFTQVRPGLQAELDAVRRERGWGPTIVDADPVDLEILFATLVERTAEAA